MLLPRWGASCCAAAVWSSLTRGWAGWEFQVGRARHSHAYRPSVRSRVRSQVRSYLPRTCLKSQPRCAPSSVACGSMLRKRVSSPAELAVPCQMLPAGWEGDSSLRSHQSVNGRHST